jgi:hypothetical protein
MANLTVEQPRISILKAEVHHGLNVQRSDNHTEDKYNIFKGKLFGQPSTTYSLK